MNLGRTTFIANTLFTTKRSRMVIFFFVTNGPYYELRVITSTKQYITKTLRDKVRIRKRWGGFFQTLLNKKSPKLDLTITALFPQRPLAPSLGVRPTIDDMMGVIRGMPNWNAVGPDCLLAEVLKLDHPEFIRYFHNLPVNVWSMGEVPQ